MEFDFLPEFNDQLQLFLTNSINSWHLEVKKLLPALPNRLDIVFDNQYLVPDKGIGGFALSREKVVLAFDTRFKGDKTDQIKWLRGSYFHECYHIIQNFVGDQRSKDLEAISYAVFEGLATKFEVIRAGVTPEWATYPDNQTMLQWTSKVKALPKGYDWRVWQIKVPKTKEKWILFRVGTYIADQALRTSNASIESLALKSPQDTLAIARLG